MQKLWLETLAQVDWLNQVCWPRRKKCSVVVCCMCLCLGRALISHSQMPRCWSCAKFVLCNLCILLMGPVWLVFFVVFKFWLSVIAKMQIILFVFSINHISFSQKMVILQFVSIPFLMQQTLLYGNLREVWVGNPAPEDWYKLCWGVQSYSERAGVGTGFRSGHSGVYGKSSSTGGIRCALDWNMNLYAQRPFVDMIGHPGPRT